MTITAQQAIDRALGDLSDSAGVTWPITTYMLPRVLDAMTAIVKRVPQAYQVKELRTLTIGESLQTVPSDVTRIVDIVRNMGTNGTTPGRSIRLANKSQLDAVSPGWHEARTENEVRNWVYDVDRPTVFYVYPRPKVAVQIEWLVAKVPPLGAIGDALPIGDVYLNAIVCYLKYRALDRQGMRRNPEKAAQHFAAFERELGMKKTTDAEQAPKGKNP